MARAEYIDEHLTDVQINQSANLGGVADYGDGYRVVNFNGWYVRQAFVSGSWQAPRVSVGGKQGIERFRQPWEAGKDYKREDTDGSTPDAI